MDAVIEDFPDQGESRGGSVTEPAEPPAAGVSEEHWNRLFKDLACGRRGALGELYDAAASTMYGLALWRTGSAEDAADVVQEVFVRVAERHRDLAKVRHARPWLLAVTRRAAVDVVRRRKRRNAQPLDDCPFLVAPEADSEAHLDAVRASSCLAKLPAAQRDVIYLHHFAGCTFAAIGEIVGIPMFTAASRYRLGMAKLRRLMEDG
jgi:RNA polymerase sigma-70 factor (ECF subfamily)